jgi:hypothetical protein
MKTPILKPGFEFIFALSLIAILGLPPMLMAQNQKNEEINIVNGDTTVNGKNIKDISAADRQDALRDIKHISADATDGGNNSHVYIFKRQDSTMRHPMITEDIVVKKDSAGNIVEMRSGRRLGRNNMRMKMRNMDVVPDKMPWMDRNGAGPMRAPMMGFARRNSQRFSYVSTDNNGISTHISFRVSGVTNDDLKRMPPVEGPTLEISDLNIVPEFSTGKTLLMFSLPAKTVAEVKLIDSNGKALWKEKATGGSFSKTFVIGLNGIYYLQVKQGNGVAVKRIVKEE